MKLLITGGAGFIGSNLVDHFLEKGHEVVVLDNLSRSLPLTPKGEANAQMRMTNCRHTLAFNQNPDEVRICEVAEKMLVPYCS